MKAQRRAGTASRAVGMPGTPATPATPDEREKSGRVRRPSDLLVGAGLLVSLAVVLALVHGLPVGARELNRDVAQAVSRHAPQSLAVVLAAAVDVGCLAWISVATVALVRSDIRSAVNAAVAFVVATGGATACVVAWASRRGGIAVSMLAGTSATMLVLTVAFTALVTGSDLARRHKWWRWCTLAVVLLAVSEVGIGELTIVAAVVGLLGGWMLGLSVRWAMRAASVRPALGALGEWLRSSGVAVVSITSGEAGAFAGMLDDGATVTVALANRDTRGSGAARRAWQSLRLRGGLGAPVLESSRAQLQAQALACYSAASAGVAAPRVLRLAEMPPETLVLALAIPPGGSLSESTPSTQVPALFEALRRLHAAGIAHRAVRADSVVVDAATGQLGFASLARAQIGAGELTRRLDLAQALTTLAALFGSGVAVRAFRDGYRPSAEEEEAVAALLQPIALAPWGWSAVRAARGCLAEVRTELVGTDDVRFTPPRLERFRWRTVASAVGLTVAGYLLVGQLSKVNLIGALESMAPGWFVVALAGSAVTYFGAALNLAAFVPQRVSMLRGFFVQLATSFVGVAMPPTVGHVAVNSRYLHRQGVNDGAVAAAVALSQLVNVVTTVPLLLVIGVLTGSGVAKLKIVPGSDVLIAAGSVVAVVGILVALPQTRVLLATYIWPRIRTVIPRLLEAASQPLRVLVSAGGNLLLTGGYVLALYAALLALGAHPSVVATAGVYLAGNTVGSLAPTPGGLGAVEIVLTAGLTGIGVPAHDAVAAVVLFRLATFWLPIPLGWVAFERLQRAGVL